MYISLASKVHIHLHQQMKSHVRYQSIVWSHFHPPVIFHPPNNAPSYLLTPTSPPTPALGQSFTGIMMKNIKFSKKGFLPVSLHRAVNDQGHGQGL